jgi:acetyl esterase/lipase
MNIKSLLKILLPLLVLFISPLIFAQEEEPENQYPAVKVPANYTMQKNVVYKQVDDWKGTLDLYLPADTSKPVPLIIDVHGGGWWHGVKESHYDFDVFFKQNWAVANVEYRLAGQSRAPSALEDVRCALIFLIKNAARLHINPDKIVIMGNSAGGHLALMTGFLGNNHLFDKDCETIENIKVMAIIDKYGGVDLRDPEKWLTKSLKIWVKSKINNTDFLSSLSPITYVNASCPPVIIIHGDADPTISYTQSETLNDKLEEAGVKHDFITVPGGGHGKFSDKANEQINKGIVEFLEELGIDKP